jgi:integrase
MNDDLIKIIVEQRAEIDRLRALRSNALTGNLSDSKIAKLTKHWTRDCDNLYIQIQHPGSRRRSWLFRWRDRVTREYRSIGLGPYPTISIDQARELALYYRQQLLEGKDPRAVRDDKKLDMLIARKLVKSVGQVAIEWFEVEITRKSPGYRTKIFNQLHKYVHPTIGDMPIQKVDANIILDKVGSPRERDGEGQVFEPLREMWVRVHPTANDVLQYLERIFKFAIKRKYYHGENPAAEARDSLPSRSDVYERGHRSELPYKDVGRFMQTLRVYEDRSVRKEGHPPIALLLEFIVLTGARLSEGRLAQWKEFDLPSMTWTTPWQHLKTGRKHRTDLPRPITKPMLAVLEEMQKRRFDQSDDALVFPGPRSGNAIITGNMGVFVANILRWEIKFHAHGFRGTLRNWMRAKTNFKDVLWKIQVDHKLGVDASDDAYGHDKLLEQRRAVMELWGEYCSKPAPEPKAGKVFNLSDKRRTA